MAFFTVAVITALCLLLASTRKYATPCVSKAHAVRAFLFASATAGRDVAR